LRREKNIEGKVREKGKRLGEVGRGAQRRKPRRLFQKEDAQEKGFR